MSNGSTRPQVGATGEQSPSPIRSATPIQRPISFDSSASDTISMRCDEIKALASCMVCLAAIEKSSQGDFAGYELIDDALPLLGGVIMRMAREVGQAGDQLWAQYTEARAIANGSEVAA
ncbi:hypothetical protein [Variovorax sp. IB41]|uniref:hypothetical protein n=1 Tax=Variovorax sp. IB41 TaxID=2779370 RepID=UPI0018E849BE|nr:hypothetical protein [Variovorax sp. IB41]MBJ2155302.1 hypothetical protein [Variovorax sp. IB41]